MNDRKLIEQNIKQHELIATKYDERHVEINNDVEQQRLGRQLGWAVSHLKSENQPYTLDFGCGTGNLTKHLLHLGCHVVTADVTPTFVHNTSALDPSNTTPFQLNGEDLREFKDDTFDLVACYSVLHHIPDYKHAVRELIRVVRPGGIVFIDHEASTSFWTEQPLLKELHEQSAKRPTLTWYIQQLGSPKWWKKRLKKTFNPRYSEEGDIHVWPDDHIEWNAIRELLATGSVDLLLDQDYLLYQPHYSVDLYNRYADRCNDMHIIVGVKAPRA